MQERYKARQDNLALHAREAFRSIASWVGAKAAILTTSLFVAACGSPTEPATKMDNIQSREQANEASAGSDHVGDELSPGSIDDARIIAYQREPESWLSYGQGYDERRFSALTQINRETVGSLGLAWHKDTGSKRAQQSTPIIADGVMYFTSTWSRVFAVDPVTGETIWRFDPKVPGEWARRLCCDVVNRGVSVYNGRVYVGTLDGRLIALDAATGEVDWEVDTLIDRTRFYSITGAPRAAKGKIFIGNGGAEFGVRGYVSAYDAASGDLAWRFFTVPGNPELPYEHPELEAAAQTWSGDKYWEYGGGGTVWNSIVYDAELDHLYIGVGNGSPWAREIRSPGGGDNLYLSSIVALNPDTGRKIWHYQTTPAENWDYTATQDISLAEMDVDGSIRKVLLQAPKNGFFYVLDRENGELLRAHPYTEVTWASHVDLETGRPVENPEVDYKTEAKWVLPGSSGGHNWQPMSTDVDAGVVYIPTQESPLLFSLSESWKSTNSYDVNTARWNPGVALPEFSKMTLVNLDSVPPSRGVLKAFDPITGETKWAVEQSYYWNGGVLGTAGGLVFQGDSQGRISAYDKSDGERLWYFDTHTSILAPPVTYAIDGVQYVSILTGGGGADLFGGANSTASFKYGNDGRLLTFKLGGDETLPEPQLRPMAIPEQHGAEANLAQISAGEKKYNVYCAACHGMFARSGGSIPDLRMSFKERQELFDEIVMEGWLSGSGMAAFDDVLSRTDVDNIQSYVQARAREDRGVALGEKEQARLTWIGIE